MLLRTGWPLVWKIWKCRDFHSCQGNVRTLLKSDKCQGKNLIREKWPKTVIVSCIFVPIRVFSSILLVPAWYEYHLTWAGVAWIVREFQRVWSMAYFIVESAECRWVMSEFHAVYHSCGDMTRTNSVKLLTQCYIAWIMAPLTNDWLIDWLKLTNCGCVYQIRHNGRIVIIGFPHFRESPGMFFGKFSGLGKSPLVSVTLFEILMSNFYDLALRWFKVIWG